MRQLPLPVRIARAGLIAATLALAGCESLDKLNPFEERETPLPGERKPLFPGGVPGVEYGAPPPQPANAPPPPAAEQPQDAPPPAEQQKRQQPRRTGQTRSAPAQ